MRLDPSSILNNYTGAENILESNFEYRIFQNALRVSFLKRELDYSFLLNDRYACEA